MAGWLCALALAAVALRLRRRLELVARAEHELRGPLTAFGLALEAARRGVAVGDRLDAELERSRAALADLAAARRGAARAPLLRRRFALERLVRSSAAAWGARVRWHAGSACVDADRGRMAQALGNLLANAAEHGGGEVVVEARRGAAGVEVAVVNPERGRGLPIAAAAARDCGGRLALERADGEFRATLELPAALA